MDRILRFAAVAALGLAFVVAAPAAKAQDGVTVGGWIEVIGGITDADKGVNSVSGISRGKFSRIAVNYDDTLNNGLVVSGRVSYILNQRDGSPTDYAPDVLYVSVGGGFGTITVGAAAPASCSLLPRPIAFVNGVNSTHYDLFTALEPTSGTFSEFGYCNTPEQVSYTTPTINGFRAMLTYAPNHDSDQGESLEDASAAGAVAAGAIRDRMDLAATWSTSMGATNVSVGVGYQQGRVAEIPGTPGIPGPPPVPAVPAVERELKSTTVAATAGMGALTFGASWFDTEDVKNGAPREYGGYTLGAKYDVGNLSLGTTWSTVEVDDGGQEDTALVLGASYAVGGGLTTWLEYMDLEVDSPPATAGAARVSTSDSIVLVGVTLGF